MYLLYIMHQKKFRIEIKFNAIDLVVITFRSKLTTDNLFPFHCF